MSSWELATLPCTMSILPAAHHLSYGRESGGADGSYSI